MKISVFFPLIALVISVSARCDGSPEPGWQLIGKCSGSGDATCHTRCQAKGYGCGGCGSWAWTECWCCNNDC
ncbi:hypothetical protein BGZ63DRAFT_373040 [Mariannaea sp. PMI_226]|nr:hypothetical protein BGZ63DRAFT_373040 [Mariannaea sp. PMI_226]